LHQFSWVYFLTFY